MRGWKPLEGSTPEKSVVVITIVSSRSGCTAPVKRHLPHRCGRDLRTFSLFPRRPGFARSRVCLDHHHPCDGGLALLGRHGPGAKASRPLHQGMCHLRWCVRRPGSVVRLGRLDSARAFRRRSVLRGVVDRVQLVDRQPVHLPHPHGEVRRSTEAAAICPAGGHHRRPGLPRCLHCSGAGDPGSLGLGVLHLRCFPAILGDRPGA